MKGKGKERKESGGTNLLNLEGGDASLADEEVHHVGCGDFRGLRHAEVK